MDKALFQEYADIKNQIAQLQKEADEIAQEVTLEMNNNELDKVESDFGTFYFTTRKIWKYSEAIDDLAENLKATKKDEEETGRATFEESKSLSFRAAKAV